MSKRLAKEIINRNAALKSERSTWDTLWQDLSNYIAPRKSDIQEQKTPDVYGYTDKIYDNTATESNMVLAAGQYDYLVSGKWFTWEAPEDLKEKMSQDAKDWYSKVSEIGLKEINRSNFGLEMHELFLDRGGFGTASVMIEEGEDTALRFTTLDIATYCIEENADKLANGLYRELELTAVQAKLKFGEENLGTQVLEALNATTKAKDKKFNFIHGIYLRMDRKMDAKGNPLPGSKNLPFASIYVCVEDCKVVRESGYEELPAAITRYLRWGKDKYGYCPSILALPTTKSLNLMEKYQDALSELAAFPRILIPEGHEGDIDLRSSGVSTFDPNNPNAVPKEWATQGRYDVGKDRAEQKREFIRDAYHVDLFSALANRDKTMTATEVLELVEEKLINFSPTFARMVVELFNPILKRVFNILYRAGKFPKPPEGVVFPTDDGGQGIALPEVSYTSKLALAMKALENKTFLQYVTIIMDLMQIKPEVVDIIDGDGSARKVAENMGVSTDFLNDEDEVTKIRTDRAEAAKAEAALAAAESASKSAANMGSAPKQIQEQLT